MSLGPIVDAVKSGKVLFSDGAWGTMLQNKGLEPGECPELWCIERAEAVYEVVKSYVDAGADMVQTNSFGGTRYKLEHFGLGDKVSLINEAAAKISKKAIGDKGWVIASMGPTGKMLVMGDVTEQDLYDAFKEQAIALEKGGADAACIETMSDTEEACLAVKAVKENTNLEIISTYTLELTEYSGYRTMMGGSPADVANAAVKAGADVIGTNCGNGIKRMIDIVKEMRQAQPDTPILVHANAGLPQRVDGADVFPDTPAEMAAYVKKLADAGANIIGGCCGTTPEHVTAMKAAIYG